MKYTNGDQLPADKSTYLHITKEMHFDVRFAISGNMDGVSFGSSPLQLDGDLYLSRDDMYFGYGTKWYTVSPKDIRRIVTNTTKSCLTLVFSNYEIDFYTNDHTHMRTLRNFLFYVKNEGQLM